MVANMHICDTSNLVYTSMHIETACLDEYYYYICTSWQRHRCEWMLFCLVAVCIHTLDGMRTISVAGYALWAMSIK